MTRRVEKGELVISFYGEDESWDERVLSEREGERLRTGWRGKRGIE